MPQTQIDFSDLGAKRLDFSDLGAKPSKANTYGAPALPTYPDQPTSAPIDRLTGHPITGAVTDFMTGAADAAGIDLSRPITSTLKQGAKGLVSAAGLASRLSGPIPDPYALHELSQAVTAPSEGVQEGAAGIRESDPYKMFHGLGKTFALTKPLAEAGAAGVKALDVASAKRAIIPVKSQIDNLSTLIQPGLARGVSPTPVAKSTQKFLREAANRIGIESTDIMTKKSGKYDLTGNLERGLTDEMHRSLNLPRDILDNPKPVQIHLIDTAVDIAHEGMASIMEKFDQVQVPTVQAEIAAELNKLSKAYTNLDPALSRAYSSLEAQVLSEEGATVGGLNRIKMHSNKEVQRLTDMLPGPEMHASATPIWAQRTLGQLVRDKLYPKLQSFMPEQEAQLIRRLGAEEANVIRGRDGMYVSFAQAAGENAPAALQSYASHVLQGIRGRVRFGATSPGLYATESVGALFKGRQPLREFNKRLQQGIGATLGVEPIPPLKFQERHLLNAGPIEMGGETATSSVTGEAASMHPGGRRALIPERTETLTPPAPVESSREQLLNRMGAQSKLMRERVKKGQIYNRQERPLAPSDYRRYIQFIQSIPEIKKPK
jgi:hypothetical protein